MVAVGRRRVWSIKEARWRGVRDGDWEGMVEVEVDVDVEGEGEGRREEMWEKMVSQSVWVLGGFRAIVETVTEYELK